MKQNTNPYPIYTYSEIFSTYFKIGCDSVSPEYTLIFIVSGELIVHCKCGDTRVKKGEYIFLRKDKSTKLERKSYENEPFISVFMGLNQSFLKKLQPLIKKKTASAKASYFSGNTIKLPKKPYLESLYISLLSYFQWDASPKEEVLEIKLIEAVYGLILTDDRFYSCLFNFEKAQKGVSDIDYASRDLSKHQTCYMSQKMESSYIMIRDDDQISNVYLDVTYKNVIHFLNAFGQGLIFPSLN